MRRFVPLKAIPEQTRCYLCSPESLPDKHSVSYRDLLAILGGSLQIIVLSLMWESNLMLIAPKAGADHLSRSEEPPGRH